MRKRVLGSVFVFAVLLVVLCSCGGKADTVVYDYNYDLSEYITIGEYKGIEYTPAVLTVKTNDTVSVSYVGKIEGEEFEGGTGTTNDLVIGSGSFIEGFEDGLIGAAPGETRELALSFPEDYKVNPDLAGTDVVFTATVNSINGYTDAEELDKAVIWETFFNSCEIIKYPEKELNGMINQQKEYYEMLAEAYGVSLDGLLDAMSMEEEELNQEIEEYAKQMVAQDMALFALARAEGIEADEDSLEAAKQTLLETQGAATEEEFKELTGLTMNDENVVNSIEVTALLQKTLDFLLENAVPKEAEAQ